MKKRIISFLVLFYIFQMPNIVHGIIDFFVERYYNSLIWLPDIFYAAMMLMISILIDKGVVARLLHLIKK